MKRSIIQLKFFLITALLASASLASYGQDCNGGTITTTDGFSEVATCPGDTNADEVSFQSEGTMGTNFAYVVTDANGVILGLPPMNTVNFEGAGEGICLVWGLSYEGNLLAQVGDTATSIDLADGCFDLSDNFVTVVRGDLDGGMIYAEGELTEVYTCPGDSVADVVNFVSSSPSQGVSNYQLVITDENGIILGLPPANSADFEGAGEGVCLAWGLYYTGNLTAQAGDDATSATLADGCFALTDNSVRIVRGDLDGGMIYAEGELTEVYTCPGDSVADVVNFVSSSPSQGVSNYQLVITDENGIILGLPPANSADFEGAGEGVCLAWGLYYTGNLTAQAGDDATSATLADGCFALTENSVRVVRDDLDGGMIYAEGELTEVYTCEGDGVADVVNFVSSSPSSGVSSYQLVITDENGIILGLPPANSADFEGAGQGVCLAWGLYYTGNLTAQAGDDATSVALSDGCFALTENSVRVVRDDLDGGMIYAEGELTEVYTCEGDGVADVVNFVSSSPSAGVSNYQLVITDENGIILGLPPANSADFEGAGEGVCLAWGLYYTGNLTAQAGDDATSVALSDGCFALTENSVRVVRDDLDGGMIYAEGELTEVYTCEGDGVADVVNFVSSSPSAGVSNYQLVITDENGIILGLPPANSADFEGAGQGVCLAWGLYYTGNLTAQAGDDATSVALSDGCFALTENSVRVVRDDLDGGMIYAEGELMEVYTCEGDGVADVVNFVSSSPSAGVSNYQLVITDENGIILGLPPANSADFEGAGQGVCLAWGLYYTGNLTAQAGDDATSVALSDGCFALTENSVRVVRDDLDGGMIYAEGEMLEVNTCPGDGNADVINFVSASPSEGVSSYQLVITDENGIILGLPPANSADFEGAGEGICLAWGLYYTGTLTAQPGDDATSVALADGCFALSDTFVTVIRSMDNCMDVSVEDELALSSFTVYPNPVQDQFTVKFNADAEFATRESSIELFNMQGIRVFATSTNVLIGSENTVSIDAGTLPSGIYLVQLRNGNQTLHKKIVKR